MSSPTPDKYSFPNPALCVIGSANVDLLMQTPHLPAVGETVGGGIFTTMFGGKGANTAIGAARAGGRVSFLACVGEDRFASEMLASLHAVGVDVSMVAKVSGVATGTAFILVDRQGSNSIAVASGANEHLDAAYLHARAHLVRGAGMVLLQCEIPLSTVCAAIELAHANNVPVLLNLAPVQELPASLLELVDVLVVNEVEAALLLARSVGDEDSVRSACTTLTRGPRRIVITLGDRGCAVCDRDGYARLPAFPVKVVDTTAAGDIFCGTLAVKLNEGCSLAEAARFASAASALSVTRLGAQASAPTRAEIDSFLEKSGGAV